MQLSIIKYCGFSSSSIFSAEIPECILCNKLLPYIFYPMHSMNIEQLSNALFTIPHGWIYPIVAEEPIKLTPQVPSPR